MYCCYYHSIYSCNTASLYSGTITAGASIRYSWWMVILVTPFMLIMAVVQAAIDNNQRIMNIIGAIVSMQISYYFTAVSIHHNAQQI